MATQVTRLDTATLYERCQQAASAVVDILGDRVAFDAVFAGCDTETMDEILEAIAVAILKEVA